MSASPRRGAPRTGEAIGARLRLERERRNIGLRELARRLGVTASLISQVETGKSKPSVSTLYGIASELGLSLDDLLFGDGAETGARRVRTPRERPPPVVAEQPVQRAHSRKVIDLESGVRWERLTAAHDPDVDFLYCTYDIGGASSRNTTLMRHPGREYGLVISGRLEVVVGFDHYELGPGDSVSFDSTTPHRYANAGDVPVHFVACVVHKR
ncbi:MAG TPA: XRE family transcriptional regulator [Actinomycetes bacterium]|jgi:transcriptional regulator with XRE-family HTH domain|nr:XRE family transcriptional regulator [Actinomycetes bacterium]